MKFFTERIDDMLRAAGNGVPSATAFLDPAEQYEAKTHIASVGGEGCLFWGGYQDAERAMLFVLPDWAIYQPEQQYSERLSAVKIGVSGYVTLSHRDYLGSLLGCGIERSCIGDIVPVEGGAVVFMTSAAAGLLTGYENPLLRVGRDAVTVSEYSPPENFDAGRKIERINGVIASARLDCVVALLAHTSREKAKADIAAGNIRLNYSVNQNSDAPISEGDIISVRGVGRFVIIGTGDRTRRDRIKLAAGRYI